VGDDYFSYVFCLFFYNVFFRSLDAEKIMQVSFCCCACVKLADIVR